MWGIYMNNQILNCFKTISKWKKGLSVAILATGILSTTLIPQNAYTHGFVEKPGSRAALCSPDYRALNVNCGDIMYEPQSLEAPKGFPQGGPIDGKIASAGGKFGGLSR